MLGQGAFGKVVKAEAAGLGGYPGSTPVAVKMARGKKYRDKKHCTWIADNRVSGRCYINLNISSKVTISHCKMDF